MLSANFVDLAIFFSQNDFSQKTETKHKGAAFNKLTYVLKPIIFNRLSTLHITIKFGSDFLHFFRKFLNLESEKCNQFLACIYKYIGTRTNFIRPYVNSVILSIRIQQIHRLTEKNISASQAFLTKKLKIFQMNSKLMPRLMFETFLNMYLAIIC